MASFLAGLPVIGGLFDDTEERAQEKLKEYEDLYKNPENYAKFTGGWTPEDVTASQITEDPGLKNMQMNYLSKLMDMSESGLSDEDKLGFEMAQREAENTAKAQQAAIVNQMRERGIGGSGAELALRSQASQDAVNRQSLANMGQAAQAAKQRALYSQAYGNQLGDMRSADYRTAASNQDALNRAAQFNAQNQNAAREYNARTQQGLENANKQTRLGGLTSANEKYYKDILAESAANSASRKALGQAAGSIIGAAVGGPAGAQVGGTMGGTMGDPGGGKAEQQNWWDSMSRKERSEMGGSIGGALGGLFR